MKLLSKEAQAALNALEGNEPTAKDEARVRQNLERTLNIAIPSAAAVVANAALAAKATTGSFSSAFASTGFVFKVVVLATSIGVGSFATLGILQLVRQSEPLAATHLRTQTNLPSITQPEPLEELLPFETENQPSRSEEAVVPQRALETTVLGEADALDQTPQFKSRDENVISKQQSADGEAIALRPSLRQLSRNLETATKRAAAPSATPRTEDGVPAAPHVLEADPEAEGTRQEPSTGAAPSSVGLVGEINEPTSCDAKEVSRSSQQARQLLREHRPAEAVALLETYQRRCPSGLWETEAWAVRLASLCQLGRNAEVVGLLVWFRTEYPAQIKQLMAELQEPCPADVLYLGSTQTTAE